MNWFTPGPHSQGCPVQGVGKEAPHSQPHQVDIVSSVPPSQPPSGGGGGKLWSGMHWLSLALGPPPESAWHGVVQLSKPGEHQSTSSG